VASAALCILIGWSVWTPHRMNARLSDGIMRVVVIGDSVAHGAGDESGRGIARCLDSELQQRGVRNAPSVNYGVNGARTFDVLRRLRNAPLVKTADMVIVSIGGNDLYGDSMARLRAAVWPEHARRRALAGVSAVVRRVHALNPSARIVLLGLYNPYRQSGIAPFLDAQINRWDACLIARFAEDPHVIVVRIADLLRSAGRLSPLDHFHPSAAGYALIAARIAPTL
jgi:lysophospholipase L1-like esterase